MSWLGKLLGAASIGRVLFALGAVALLATAGGIYTGVQWERGQRAIADRDTLTQDVARLIEHGDTLRQHAATNAADARTYAHTLDVIIADQQGYLDALETALSSQQTALEKALASIDAAGCRVGDDGLRALHAAAAGVAVATAGAARADAVDVDAAMPRGAAAGGRRFNEGDQPGVRGSGSDVSPLPESAGRTGNGSDGT